MKKIYKIAILSLVAVLTIVAFLLFASIQFEKGISSLKDQEFEKAHEILIVFAALGHTESQILVGQLYAFGRGVNIDFEAANQWFNRAGRFSLLFATPSAEHKFYVGRDFIEGSGVPVNTEEGLRWVRQAAKEGYPDAVKYIAQINK